MVISYQESDLPVVGKSIAGQLKPGNIVAFYGPLAAGKTSLIREITRELGYNGIVNSPTFVIEHRYKISTQHLEEIIHLDLYRLAAKDIKQFDWSEFSDKNKITFIEWPERAEDFLPKNIKKIHITKTSETGRELKLSPNFHD